MEPLTARDFAREAGAFDAEVARAGELDRFCSASDWIVPAAEALMPEREPWLFRGDAGWVAAMRGRHPEGWWYVEPFEAMWGLSCPFVGRDPAGIARAADELFAHRAGDWDVLLLSGLIEGSELLTAVGGALSRRYPVRLGPRTRRHIASLEGGLDGFLARRSRNMRKGFRRARRRAVEAGVTFERASTRDPDAAEVLYERALAVESRSWKGRAGVGVDTGRMADFYRRMTRRLARRGALRLIFARHAGRDVGYVLGGVFAAEYRGLQFSYDDDHGALSLGNLLQLEQIADLAAEGVETYDLGTGLDYKYRWAEQTIDSVLLIAVKPR